MYTRSTLLTGLFHLFFFAFSHAQGETCPEAVAITLPGGVGQVALNADGPSTGNGPSTIATGIFPGITHADWYAFTPPADGVITISSCGGGVDSYVFLHQGSCGNLTNVDLSDDDCDQDNDPGTPNNFASLLENIPVTQGTTYYIEWTNAWDDRPFGWTFSFQQVGGDVAMESGLDFTRLPAEQAQAGIPVKARIVSNGPATAENIQIDATIRDEGGAIVDQGSTQLAQLLAGTSQESTVFSWSPGAEGRYTITYVVDASNNDLPGNDTLRQEVVISDAVYALDDDQLEGTLGGVPDDTVTQGQVFTFLAGDLLRSVSAFILGGRAGEQLRAEVYAYENNQPAGLLASSSPITLEGRNPGWLHFRFDLGSAGLPVSANDQLLIAVTYFSQGGQSGLGYAGGIYRPGRTWLRSKSTGDDWVSLESQGQTVSYLLRANNGIQAQQLTLTADLFNQAVEGQLQNEVFLAWYDQDSDLQFSPMSSNGDSTYTATIQVQALDTISYVFVNGNADPANFEMVPASCSVPVLYEGANLNVRRQVVNFDNEALPVVCFAGCTDCASAPCLDPAALICERFESYTTGPISPQSADWSVQAGGADGTVSTDVANSGQRSLRIDGTVANQSVLLDLDDLTAGTWELQMEVYVPAGRNAAYNIQHQTLPEIFAAFVELQSDGTGSVQLAPGNALATFNYPADTWFSIRHLIDLVHDQARLYVNGQAVFAWRFSEGVPSDLLQLASVNFKPADSNTLYYVDDIFLRSVNTPPANDLCAFALDLTPLFGGPEGIAQVSALQNNLTATADGFDPTTGYACFQDNASLDNTLWFTFTGDGFRYGLETVECNATDYLQDGNTQMAVYTGRCDDLQPVACNETRPGTPGGQGPAGLDLDTEPGETYYVLIDGFRSASLAQGEFCVQVTRGMLSGLPFSPNLSERIRLFPNPTSDQSQLEVTLPEPGNLYVELLDPLGRVLWGRYSADQGVHRIPLDLNSYPAGMYLVRIRHESAVWTQPLILR